MPDKVLRPFEPEDLPRLCEIAIAAWKPIYEHWEAQMSPEMFAAAVGPDWRAEKAGQIEQFCTDYPHWCLVTEIDGIIVGFITWVIKRDRSLGEIGNNAVDPECQGRGVGSGQYRRVLEIFRDEGMCFAKVQTGLDEPHAPARAAYENVGFRQFIPSVAYFREV